MRELKWLGRHWGLGLWPNLFVNIPIPFAPHRILIVGLGRLSQRGRWHALWPCCYMLTLGDCCGQTP